MITIYTKLQPPHQVFSLESSDFKINDSKVEFYDNDILVAAFNTIDIVGFAEESKIRFSLKQLLDGCGDTAFPEKAFFKEKRLGLF